ncbi:substrate-binding periplasmic protein [Agarivorans aestuarii]|uniref:substrate-binding periplasmic protein n=1 Tax=Agarivorans aestuarii TaxID=1563703 RepID=UPI001C80FB51|nr:transporter substrate-binding domain-containing protein [Agarivorans aestuarii]
MRIAAYCYLALLWFCAEVSAQELTIATGEHPPFTSHYLNDHGFINAVIKAAFKTSNIHVKYRYLPWQRALSASQAGTYSATSYWAKKQQRNSHFLHSDPLWYGGSVLVSLSKNGEYNSLSSLQGKVIGAVRGYTYSEEFWQLGKEEKYEIQEVNSDLQNLKKLLAGRIDAFIIDNVAASVLIKNQLTPYQQAAISVSKNYIITASVHLLISRKTHRADLLLKSFNKGLQQIVSNGTYHKISLRYPMIEHGLLKPVTGLK